MHDMVRGAPVIYLVEAGFDEVSHRRGPDSPQALRELSRIDQSLADLHAISHALDRPYDLYVFSDHGQTGTVPYEQLAGRTLAEALRLPGSDSEPLSAGLLRALMDGRRALPPIRRGAERKGGPASTAPHPGGLAAR
jgi:hypothetical protein